MSAGYRNPGLRVLRWAAEAERVDDYAQKTAPRMTPSDCNARRRSEATPDVGGRADRQYAYELPGMSGDCVRAGIPDSGQEAAREGMNREGRASGAGEVLRARYAAAMPIQVV